MTTRLAGTATRFLPFNKGCDGAAGNPPDPAGRTYRTAYLWEEVLQRDSLLDLLARFIHLQMDEKRDDQGRKVKTESMIFPRYHQLQAVRMLVAAARSEGVGHNYLVEHSAGSGKSNMSRAGRWCMNRNWPTTNPTHRSITYQERTTMAYRARPSG